MIAAAGDGRAHVGRPVRPTATTARHEQATPAPAIHQMAPAHPARRRLTRVRARRRTTAVPAAGAQPDQRRGQRRAPRRPGRPYRRSPRSASPHRPWPRRRASRQPGRRGGPARRGRRPWPRPRRPATTARRSPRPGPARRGRRRPAATPGRTAARCGACRSLSTPWICAPTSSVSVRPCAVASVRICSSSARPSEVTRSARVRSASVVPFSPPARRARPGRAPPGGPARPGRPTARRHPTASPSAVPVPTPAAPAVADAPPVPLGVGRGRPADPRCRRLPAGRRRPAPSRGPAGWDGRSRDPPTGSLRSVPLIVAPVLRAAPRVPTRTASVVTLR